jgi:tRNA(Ile2)-agmatinylcytidine synthase
MRSVQLHIGIDDTDSRTRGCTTYLCSLLVQVLLRDFGVRFLDYPLLIRLNPNIPWKTRGNGAVCLRMAVRGDEVEDLKDNVVKMVLANSEMQAPDTDPAVVFYDHALDGDFEAFYRDALMRVVPLEYALRFAREKGCEVHAFKSKRGIIGSIASIGAGLKADHTFELISYRDRSRWGKPRLFDRRSVMEMDAKVLGTFNNLDPETGRILIAPHGHDPVLMGIRGEEPVAVLDAFKAIQVLEPVERWTIFRSNQGTDAHLPASPVGISSLQPYESVCAEGSVVERPRGIRGGHLIFPLRDETGEIDCAAYEPTGSFRDVVSKLEPEDRIRAFGGVRSLEAGRLTLNMERLQVMALDAKVISRPPLCPRCGTRCKSSGLRQGYRCRKCGYWRQQREEHPSLRAISVGTFIPPPRAQRHLTKPAKRYGLEKGRCRPPGPVEPWHLP